MVGKLAAWKPLFLRAAVPVFVLLTPWSGCAGPGRSTALPLAGQARVDLLVRAHSASLRVVLELESASLIDEDGGSVELPLRTGRLDSHALARHESLAAGEIPARNYTSLGLRWRSAVRVEGEVIAPLVLEGGETAEGSVMVETRVPVLLKVGSRDAISLFLQWDVDASLRSGGVVHPQFGISVEIPRARLGMLYVADRASGLVFGVDRRRMEVVASIEAGEGPAALSLSRDRRFLAVANAGSGSVSILDLVKGNERVEVPIRFSAMTSDVVMVDSMGLVAATNPALDTVTLFDLESGSRLADLTVGDHPVRLAAAQNRRRLVVLNQREDSVSVIDLITQTVIATLPTRDGPSDLALDRREEIVAVGHLNSPELLLFDAETLQQIHAVHAGDRVSAILSDRRRDQFYVARTTPPELVVVDRRLAAATRRIPLSAPVAQLAQSAEDPRLFGASPTSGGLLVINLVRGQEEPPIPCGREPSDVLVAQ